MIASGMMALVLAGASPAECVPAPKEGYAGAYAEPWFINNEAIQFKGQKYEKYGLPRVLGKDEVEPIGRYKLGYFYGEAGSKGRQVIYLLTRLDGCEFQPYIQRS